MPDLSKLLEANPATGRTMGRMIQPKMEGMKMNPFELVTTPDGPALLGLLPETKPSHGNVRTAIAVCEGGGSHGNASAVHSIEGRLWEPPVGAVVYLGNPNRDATVCVVRYQIEPEGTLCSVVYLDDPKVTKPDPKSAVRTKLDNMRG